MRYLITIAYDGTNYNGWQIQPNKITVQGVIESAIECVLGEKTPIFASGRTDAMVSAVGQVAHFDAQNLKNDFLGHVNALLPDIRITDLKRVDDNFNARFDAKRKTYRYYFYTGKVNNPYLDKFASHVKYSLNLGTMQTAIKCLNGAHNFKSFCAMHSSVKDYDRVIYNAQLKQDGNLFVFEITGNGFLYNMVRIIVGTLIDIGRGKITASMSDIISARDRNMAGKTAEAKGLVLQSVDYGNF